MRMGGGTPPLPTYGIEVYFYVAYVAVCWKFGFLKNTSSLGLFAQIPTLLAKRSCVSLFS